MAICTKDQLQNARIFATSMHQQRLNTIHGVNVSGFELNKIAASVLLAGVIAMLAGFITEILYHPMMHVAQRGYQVAVSESTPGAAADAKPAEEVFLVGQLMAQADAAAGKENFKKCATCHTIDKGGPNRVGPNLWGIVGDDKIRHNSYDYSQALTAKGGKWGYEELFHFLHSPKTYVPGTKMGFIGFKNKADVANMIAYLRTQADAELPLPSVEKEAPAAADKPAAEPATNPEPVPSAASKTETSPAPHAAEPAPAAHATEPAPTTNTSTPATSVKAPEAAKAPHAEEAKPAATTAPVSISTEAQKPAASHEGAAPVKPAGASEKPLTSSAM